MTSPEETAKDLANRWAPNATNHALEGAISFAMRRYASERVGIERLRCAGIAREEGRRETALRREDCAETAWRIAERIEEK